MMRFLSTSPAGGATPATATEYDLLLAKKYDEALQRIKELEDENKALRRKQVEINTAKELYLKIFEDFPALIWRSRLDKLCDYFNRTWCEWTGKTLEQEFGNGWAQGVHPDDFDACLETYVKAFDNRESFYMEYRLLDKHGEYRWIGDHGRPFYDLDGETFLGYIGSCYDITENKVNEQKLVQLNATKDKLFSLVAHDLRNPISTFVSLSEFLMENHNEFNQEEMTEIAMQMHRDSKNTLLLLEHLLEWSRSQSETISFHPQTLDLSELFQTVVSEVDMVAKAKKITIQTYTQTCPLQVDADRNMLKTVLRNLLMNAIKFTNKGGHIQLKAEETTTTTSSTTRNNHTDNKMNDNNNNTCTITIPSVLVTVQDDGVGISNDQIDDLFSLVESARTKLGTDNEGGSGLGLVICQDFIQRHDGTIWAESEVGKGTLMKIILPKDQSPEAPKKPSSSTSVVAAHHQALPLATNHTNKV